MTKRQLKAAIAAARSEGPRGKYTPKLRTAVIEYCLREKTAGTTWEQLGLDLGLHSTMLHAWRKTTGRRPRGRLRAVRVVEHAASATPAATIRLELPGGGIVTGLSTGELAQLLMELRCSVCHVG